MTNRKCKATLKSGKRCTYKALGKSGYCGNHASKAKGKDKHYPIAKQVSGAERDAKLALVLNTGLALVELVEKAITHYPALLSFLESFRELTGNQWRYTEVIGELKALSAYKLSMDRSALAGVSGRDPFSRDKIATAKQAEKAAIVIAIHNVALTHWAASTVLCKLSRSGGEFRSFGHMPIAELAPLSPDERIALAQIYQKCREIPFIDELRTRNFVDVGMTW